jgi:hypothetical protein
VAEREIYNPNTGQWEVPYDDGIYETNPVQPFAPAPPITGTPAPPTPPSPTPPPPTGGGGDQMNPNKPPPPTPGWTWEWDGANGWRARPAGSPNPIPGTLGGENFGFGGSTLPNQDFQWPQYDALEADYPDFPGFSPFKQPTMEDILGDPVLQAQLNEGRAGIKRDRAFRGTLRSGDTLRDLFDWTGDRIKLGAHDAFDRAFKVYDVNERQNPFNTWAANRDLYFQELGVNNTGNRDEFLYNEMEPARKLWDQNYNKWAKQGDWLATPEPPPG